MTLSVCSTCQNPIPGDARYCPRCGPDSLTFIVSDESDGGVRGGDPEIAQRLARALGADYEVLRLLGRGGFAEVHEVRDTGLQRHLAVKVLRPDIAWTAGMLARFKQEARAIARLQHPNTLPIHFVGEGEGLVFYTMPFVEGQSLADLLRDEGALEPARAVAIAVPILEALDYAHRNGLIHRDIKPDNVLIEAASGRPLLVDFGIAKTLDTGSGDGHQTLDGFVVGTPLYMSPEQALGHRNVDARSDLYGMGAMLFQMLTGAPPFEGTTSQEIVSKHLTEPVPVPSRCDARIPVWLSDIIVRCMAKRPADRYASAAEVLEALRAGGDGAAPQGLVTAARVVRRLSSDSPTEPMSGEAVAAARAAARTASGQHARRARRRVARLVGAAALVAVAGVGSLVAIRPRPTLVVENRLLEPVQLVVNGAPAETLPPGDSARVRLERGEPLVADWRLVRPISRAGLPMGEELRGRFTLDHPSGVIRRYVGVETLGRPYFAPLITNAAGLPLRVTVSGAQGPGCDCEIAPGTRGARIGYYALSDTSAVRARDTLGRRASFAGLGTRISAGSGIVELSIAPDDLVGARPTQAAARRERAEPKVDPVPRPIPIDTFRLQLPPDSLVADTADSQKAEPRPDPLRGIFPGR